MVFVILPDGNFRCTDYRRRPNWLELCFGDRKEWFKLCDYRKRNHRQFPLSLSIIYALFFYGRETGNR